MRSLWAGVTGLQAHQIAMDVEGNNIANVNTTGFKYSRANFSDLLSQTAKIATAPQGELGGKNSMQIGLGTQVSSVTKIFKQGSVQVTDKNTDLAIQGDGFFVVSPDGGKTYKYTRNGDFNFDALGNFSESNGYIIQGWVRDEGTGEIDSTAPIRNITIPPGLTTPANDTGYITLKANLDSGNNVGTSKSAIYALDQYSSYYDRGTPPDGKLNGVNEFHIENDEFSNAFNSENTMVERGLDMGVLFNATGDAFTLTEGQGIWVSYAEAKVVFNYDSTADSYLNISLNGVLISGAITSASEVVDLINTKQSSTGVRAVSDSGGTQVTLINTNKDGNSDNTKNISIIAGADTSKPPNDSDFETTEILTAYKYTYSPTVVSPSPSYDKTNAREFKTTEDLRAAMQTDARLYVNYNGTRIVDADIDGNIREEWSTLTYQEVNRNDGVEVIVNELGQFQINNPSGDAMNIDDGDIIAGVPTTTGYNFLAGTSFIAGDFVNNTGGTITILAANNDTGADITILDGGTLGTDFTLIAAGWPYTHAGNGLTFSKNIPATTADIDHAIEISIKGYSDGNNINENTKFTTAMGALQGSLTTGVSYKTSQNIYAATHASSIDAYDSLGSKHTIRFEFMKTKADSTNGSEWSVTVRAPDYAKLNYSGSGPDNIITGVIGFDSNGSLKTSSLTNLTFTANNGSTPNQNIELRFGTIGQFDGMTSFDSDSNTSGISQDGYPGGDLGGIRVDETGTLIGSFTNGRSFGLAQVAMAKFTNNEGLESDGGNTFIQTSNSGDPVIGSAAVGGRGFIQASSLEMSNVDLSRSLTQLIVIQRGYQANSKTITTSDQMLNTLLQLKQ